MKINVLIHHSVALMTLAGFGTAGAEFEPAARALVAASAAELKAVQTIRLSAKHKINEEIGTGGRLDKGSLQITFQRSNRIHVFQEADL